MIAVNPKGPDAPPPAAPRSRPAESGVVISRGTRVYLRTLVPGDLALLGAPSADVWKRLAEVQDTPFVLSDGDAAQLASEAKARFAILSVDTALALSSAILTPASTTGYAGFDVDAA